MSQQNTFNTFMQARLITMTRMTHGISSLQNILENIGAGHIQSVWQQSETEVPYIWSHPDL